MVQIADFPDEVLELIAACAAPPDVHNLWLAVTGHGATPRGHRQPAALSHVMSDFCDTDADANPHQHQQQTLSWDAKLCKRLLKSSLVENMKLVLKRNSVSSFSDSFDLFTSFVNLTQSLEPNSVIMSGSIVVQAALGEPWEGSDIDIYCSYDAAPVVRSWLITDVNQVLCGINTKDSSYFHEDIRDSPISHVEHWANAPNDKAWFLCADEAKWQFNWNASHHPSPIFFQDDEPHHGETEIDDDLHPRVVETHRDALSVPFEPRLLDQKGKDKKACINVDLIVIKPRFRIFDAIDNFDIAMCKCMWDGSSFRIPNMTDTFARRSALCTNRRRELQELIDYSKGMANETRKSFKTMRDELRKDDPEDALSWMTHGCGCAGCAGIARKTLRIPHECIPSLEKTVDTLGIFSARLDDDLPMEVLATVKGMRIKLMRNVLGNTHWDDYARHNSIAKWCNGLDKYKVRGIEVKPFPVASGAMRVLPMSFPRVEMEDAAVDNDHNHSWMPRDHHEVQNADLIISRVEREQERRVMENEQRRWEKYDALLERVHWTGLES